MKEESMLHARVIARVLRRARRPSRFTPFIEALEERSVLAVTALFSPANGGTLSVFGDSQDNAIAVGRDAAGALRVNGGAVLVAGGSPTVTNTALIQIFGQSGNDNLRLDE